MNKIRKALGLFLLAPELRDARRRHEALRRTFLSFHGEGANPYSTPSPNPDAACSAAALIASQNILGPVTGDLGVWQS